MRHCLLFSREFCLSSARKMTSWKSLCKRGRVLVFVFAVLCHFTPLAAAYEDIVIVESSPNENVTLTCTAQMKPGLQYHAVRWYKETGVPRLTGLVSRALPDGDMRWYVGADTHITLEEGTLNLQLPTVSCSDQAVYQCYLAAPVGQQNREGRVQLTVTGCPTQKPRQEETAAAAGGDRGAHIDTSPLESGCFLQRQYLLLCGAVGLMFSALIVFLISHRSLKKTLWTETKTPGKELFSDSKSPLEKQNLIWTLNLEPAPQRPDVTVA